MIVRRPRKFYCPDFDSTSSSMSEFIALRVYCRKRLLHPGEGLLDAPSWQKSESQ